MRNTLMNYEDFENRLTAVELSKGAFAEMVGRTAPSITNWKQRGVPEWVDSWLENYRMAQLYIKCKEQKQAFVSWLIAENMENGGC